MTHKPPEILDKIADLVLAFRPKPKSKGARKRKKAVKKLAETIAADVVEGRERANKRIEKARQEIEDGALSRKGRFRL